MVCCSEITKSEKIPENIFDYLFKLTFIILSSSVIIMGFPLKAVFPINIFHSSLVFFNKKFVKDVHKMIINLNSNRISCKISSSVYVISPRLAGFIYRNFGYIILIVILLCIIGGIIYVT